jgi:hypothetical protein
LNKVFVDAREGSQGPRSQQAGYKAHRKGATEMSYKVFSSFFSVVGTFVSMKKVTVIFKVETSAKRVIGKQSQLQVHSVGVTGPHLVVVATGDRLHLLSLRVGLRTRVCGEERLLLLEH